MTQRRGDGLVARRFEYDADGLPTALENGGGQRLTLSYDPDGLMTSLTLPDFEGQPDVVDVEMDGRGQILSVTRAYPDGPGTMTYSYDTNGRRTSIVDALGHEMSFEYDVLGRMTAYFDKTGQPTTWTYDANGRELTKTNRNGEVLTRSYDDAGRLATMTGPGVDREYRYDALGRLVLARAGDHVEERRYGPIYLEELSVGGTGFATAVQTMSRDAAGRVETLTGPFTLAAAGQQVDHSYDARGRLSRLEELGLGVFQFGYDAAGRPSTLGRPDGTITTTEYDDADRTVATTTRGGAPVWADTLERDVTGRIFAVTDAFGRHEYGYDAKGQLVSADHPPASDLVDELYAYDANGNREEWNEHDAAQVAYDAEERLIQDVSFTHDYDDEGRLLWRTDRATLGTTTYMWDSFDRLRRVDYDDGETTIYRYDGLGRRVEVIDHGVATRFGYDDGGVRLVFDDSNERQSWQTTDLGGFLLAEVDAAGVPRDALLNHLGTLTAWADELGVIDAVERDPFGNGLSLPTRVEPAALTWHEMDPNGLVYAGARYLDPQTGRFISSDPFEAGNRYSYAMNDPINAWDPYGLTAASEEGALDSKTSMASREGARRIGRRLQCILNTTADLIEAVRPADTAWAVADTIQCFAAAGGKKPPPGSCPKCLTGEMEVAGPDGSTPISEIDVGDLVVATWGEVGEWEAAVPGGEVNARSAYMAFDFGSDGSPSPRLGDLVDALDRDGGALLAVEAGFRVAYAGVVCETRTVGAQVEVRRTGQVLARVLRTHRRVTGDLVELELVGDDGRSLLRSTPDHLIYDAALGVYGRAGEVTVGTTVLGREGQVAAVIGFRNVDQGSAVHNLEIEGAHNYFAGSRGGPLVAVHNGGRCSPNAEICRVSRWGSKGLKPGDWVMLGGPTLLNWLKSGKWQPGLSNTFAPLELTFPGLTGCLAHFETAASPIPTSVLPSSAPGRANRGCGCTEHISARSRDYSPM